MNRIKSLIVATLAIAGVALSGCIFINSSTISSSAAKGTPVSTTASDWGILMLTAPQGITSTANGQLEGQCASGKIGNVSTEMNMRNFFVAQYYTVSVAGSCE